MELLECKEKKAIQGAKVNLVSQETMEYQEEGVPLVKMVTRERKELKELVYREEPDLPASQV